MVPPPVRSFLRSNIPHSVWFIGMVCSRLCLVRKVSVFLTAMTLRAKSTASHCKAKISPCLIPVKRAHWTSSLKSLSSIALNNFSQSIRVKYAGFLCLLSKECLNLSGCNPLQGNVPSNPEELHRFSLGSGMCRDLLSLVELVNKPELIDVATLREEHLCTVLSVWTGKAINRGDTSEGGYTSASFGSLCATPMSVCKVKRSKKW